jgi:hypothetical protein
MVRIIFHQLINDSSTKNFTINKEITEAVFLNGYRRSSALFLTFFNAILNFKEKNLKFEFVKVSVVEEIITSPFPYYRSTHSTENASSMSRELRRPEATVFLHCPDGDGHLIIIRSDAAAGRHLPLHHGAFSLLQKEHPTLAEFKWSGLECNSGIPPIRQKI